MNIQFPQNLSTIYFYSLTLRKLCHFLYTSDSSSELVIDVSQTKYIEPSVLCDLTSYLYLLQNLKDVNVYIIFGENKDLISFMNRCKFLNLSQFGKMFKTDIVTLPPEDEEDSDRKRLYGKSVTKAENTEHIRMVPLPKLYNVFEHEYLYGKAYESLTLRKMITNEVTNNIRSQINKDLSILTLRKKDVMIETRFKESLYNIVGSLSPVYSEIVDNSIRHGSDNSGDDRCCFYTFHFYRKTGLCFGNSDVGDGFYESLRKKFKSETIKPAIFSYEEFMDPDNSLQNQSLMGILEGMAYRLNKKLEYGLPYILSTIVLELNGQLTIHSDCAALVLTRKVIKDLFVIEKNSNYLAISDAGDIQYNKYLLAAYQRESMHCLALDNRKKKEYIDAGMLHFYDYHFPGVHISATIDAKELTEQ